MAAGVLENADMPIGDHCSVTGFMNERVSPVDGDTYRIGFEMRLPVDWSGRHLHQGNGGIDGFVRAALGDFGGGGPLVGGLQLGMAILSSDAGRDAPSCHSSASIPRLAAATVSTD